MEQTAHNRHNTRKGSLSPAPLFALIAAPSQRSDGEVHLWLPHCQRPFPHLPLTVTSKTYCCAHGFIMSRGQAGGGMGRLAHTWTKQGLNVQACGGEETWTSLDDWAGRSKYEGWGKKRLDCRDAFACSKDKQQHTNNYSVGQQVSFWWLHAFDFLQLLNPSALLCDLEYVQKSPPFAGRWLCFLISGWVQHRGQNTIEVIIIPCVTWMKSPLTQCGHIVMWSSHFCSYGAGKRNTEVPSTSSTSEMSNENHAETDQRQIQWWWV